MPWKQQLPSPQSPSPVQPSLRGHADGSGGVLQPQLSGSQMYSRPSPHNGGSSTVSGPHPLDPRDAWSPAPVSVAFVSEGPAPGAVAPVPDDPVPGLDEQLNTRRAAATGATRERSSNIVLDERIGPSLLHRDEAASPNSRAAYHPPPAMSFPLRNEKCAYCFLLSS